MEELTQIQSAFPGFGVGPSYFCRNCHRPLSNPNSIQAGMGPVCRGHNGTSYIKKENEMEDICDRQIFDKDLNEALVLKRDGPRSGSSIVLTNVPHLVKHHSPTGFEFGYGGSGPADLALNICEWYLLHTKYEGARTQCWDGNCFKLGYALHQDFKRDFIAGVPDEGTEIPFGEIQTWFDLHITDDLKDAYVAPREWD